VIPDACPECDPLTHPASLPDARGVYECPSGHGWRTARDEHGWPLGRTAQPQDTRAAEWPSPGRAA
jgi:hypothetical protein